MTDVEKQLVRTLKNETGYGMLDCKKALQKYNGDMEQAKMWLDEKAKISEKTSLVTKRENEEEF